MCNEHEKKVCLVTDHQLQVINLLLLLASVVYEVSCVFDTSYSTSVRSIYTPVEENRAIATVHSLKFVDFKFLALYGKFVFLWIRNVVFSLLSSIQICMRTILISWFDTKSAKITMYSTNNNKITLFVYPSISPGKLKTSQKIWWRTIKKT